ncbi:ATP-binding cassette domain-containing protein [Hydrogenophaga sp. UC242_50]|uniref:ATP-binding cassette domain-containing protein n=1 Tax=unclassified Hydrogenophaga TaxID=2610897 RepID=UPI0036D40644
MNAVQVPPVWAVDTESLTVRFGGVVAVDRVNLQVARGELRCLIGPNGAGKSTLFKTLTGQQKPSAGRVRILGQDVGRLERHQIARLGVGVKTQVPSVFDGLTVGASLRVAAGRHRERRPVAAVVDEVLEQLRLGAVRDRQLATLSHGQRQWVELGMVLRTDAQLVLLDEPVAGMSEEETARTAELILSIRAGRAVVVVEHDMRFVRRIADRVTVLHRGAVLRDGPVAEVLADPVVRDVYLGREEHVRA